MQQEIRSQVLPLKMTSIAKFFVDNIFPGIVAANPGCGLYRRLVGHMDNASPHQMMSRTQKLEENGIVASPHPAFSPNLAPSDLFLFGALKDQLAGRTSESADELVGEICEMMMTSDG
jgi:hypothetical protein